MDYLFYYLIVVNFITFVLFVLDKKRARKREWRIPENLLLLFSFLGGSVGGLLAMMIVKHKTKKPKFTIGMPLLILVNIFIFYFLFFKI